MEITILNRTPYRNVKFWYVLSSTMYDVLLEILRDGMVVLTNYVT